ncbi:DinB family protein [Brevibacterium sp.]|uniref:DinB family protein n=1 Tax=Brevibacterium sp. TaxID=1701 RepID=UPI0028114577|nr:DinB family protein [Brevibacterium sp.]
MSFFAPSVTTESDALFSFIEQQAIQLRLTAFDLTDEQARTTPTTSALSISGLIAHSAQVIYGWMQQVKDPSRVFTLDDYMSFGRAIGIEEMCDGSVVPDLTLAELLAAFDTATAEIAAARGLVDNGQVDLDSTVPVPDMPWYPKDFVMNVRWILNHISTELARHAGHADIIRESIDGAIAYELNARADGEPWPPEYLTDDAEPSLPEH